MVRTDQNPHFWTNLDRSHQIPTISTVKSASFGSLNFFIAYLFIKATVFVGEISTSFDAEVPSLLFEECWVHQIGSSSNFDELPIWWTQHSWAKVPVFLEASIDPPWPIPLRASGEQLRPRRCPRALWPSAVPSAPVERPGSWRSISCAQGVPGTGGKHRRGDDLGMVTQKLGDSHIIGSYNPLYDPIKM